MTAYSIGLTTEQFWRTRPVDFYRMVDGYERRTLPAAMYFRELYALLFNVNRGEKTPYLEPSSVLQLPGEKTPRKVKPRTTFNGWSQERIDNYMERINRAYNTETVWTSEAVKDVLSRGESTTPPTTNT